VRYSFRKRREFDSRFVFLVMYGWSFGVVVFEEGVECECVWWLRVVITERSARWFRRAFVESFLMCIRFE
jgi:hypothetical protein